MSIMKKFILIILLLSIYTNKAYAKVVSLTCISIIDKTTFGLDFDEKEKIVIIAGRLILANIDSHNISYRLNLPSGEYLHLLNRSSGIMNVSISGNDVQSFRCNLRNNKF